MKKTNKKKKEHDKNLDPAPATTKLNITKGSSISKSSEVIITLELNYHLKPKVFFNIIIYSWFSYVHKKPLSDAIVKSLITKDMSVSSLKNLSFLNIVHVLGPWTSIEVFL